MKMMEEVESMQKEPYGRQSSPLLQQASQDPYGLYQALHDSMAHFCIHFKSSAFLQQAL